MLLEGRKSGFRTVTVGGVVSGLFAVPLRRRLERVEPRVLPRTSKRTLSSPSRYLNQIIQSSYPIREDVPMSIIRGPLWEIQYTPMD